MNMPNLCIYCRNELAGSNPPSVSHCFPDAIGGLSYTTNTVCVTCNNQINSQVENPVIRSLAFFQNIWRIESRRGKVPRLRAVLRIAGLEGDVVLDETGTPVGPMVLKSDKKSSSKSFSVIGRGDQVEEKRLEIERKYPSVQWTELPLGNTAESEVRIELNLCGDKFRRLAAKVAFERLSQIRASEIFLGQEFDDIRRFIRDGEGASLCCGLVSDLQLLNGSLNFPLPNHGVAIIGHPQDPILGAFVTFYGLFPYWVVLSTRYTSLMPFDDLLLEHPQRRVEEHPVLRQNLGSVRVNWSQMIEKYKAGKQESVRIVRDYAIEKFRSALDEYYGKQST